MTIQFDVTDSHIITGAKIFRPSKFEEERGNIWTSYLATEIDNHLPSNLTFLHDKFSTSNFNVLRGIHGDEKTWKLATCVFGEILQVLVDLRQDSASFGKWEKIEIDRKSPASVLIPPGVGNAYYVKSENAVYHYKLAYDGAYLDAQDQFSVAWDDASIGIDWGPISPILSNRDKNAPSFKKYYT
ncbi:dTDP-4-dehydrorhamnose 3,5-epimerase family protein [Maritalea sp. S77]|uniref:dTDP-4-dehydrorhamnose 3,5-epimerase family protein n=1 Tax=Maritalea sp. S77 TaxID=3415125 RepID=UPI003C79E7BB